MNAEFPPIEAQQPTIRRRRRQGRSMTPPPPIPAAVRRDIALRIHDQIRTVQSRLRVLTPEQKRAVFLKLTADRPLTKDDLAGTGLTLIAQSGATESLVVPRRDADLSKFEARIEGFGEGQQPDRPKGTELATALQRVELGNARDRLSEALAQAYDRLITAPFVKYEIEVTSFKSRPHGPREVESLISQLRQAIAAHGVIYEHEMHGCGARVLLGTTGAMLRELVESPRWGRAITFFDERPRFETFTEVLENFNVGNITIGRPDDDSETICVIDTGVSGLNPFLENIVRRDISRSFISNYSPLEDGSGHGSGVASLASYHSLDISTGGINTPQAWIASARITTDEAQLDYPPTDDLEADRRREARLLSTLLREIVGFYVPLGVKVFVLAFQILGQIWSKANRRAVPRNAWLARTLDQLSREHDIVFVTITGNLTAFDIRELMAIQPYPNYLNLPLAKLHDPGQAALAVGVGSIAHSATVNAAPHQPMALVDQPSPFTRSGPGFGEAIKPDVVERGGNFVYDSLLRQPMPNVGTNVQMASRFLTPALQQNVGTSFAAPRIAFHLSRICRDLRRVGTTPTAPLLRALLAASAEVPENAKVLGADIDRNVSGYGLPDGTRATDCSGSSALLFWQGNVSVDHNALFRIHVPAELAEVGRGKKRIVVAIASAPPVQEWGVAEYLGAEVVFRLYRGDRDYAQIANYLQREDNEPNTPLQATEDSMTGVPTISARSVGTLQRASFEWSDHDPRYSSDDYTLAITLSGASWVASDTEIPLGVTVRIEDTTGRCQELYTRVRARARERARA